MNTFGSVVHDISEKIDDKNWLDVQTIDFVDKKIVYVKYNGEIDTTFDVQAPESKSLYDIASSSTKTNDFSYEKTCLIGDQTNIKLAVLVNHIAKLFYTSNETKGLVISLSSKIFKSRDANKEDFDRLLFVLDLVKKSSISMS